MRLVRPLTLAEVASITEGKLEGSPEFVVHGLASLDNARPDELSFIRDPSYLPRLKSSRAGAVLAPAGVGAPGKEMVRCEDPDLALATLARKVEASFPRAPGVDERAFVSPGASLDEGVSVGPFAIVEDEATVGALTVLGAGVYLGRGVKVGRDCVLHPNSSVLRACVLGDRVVVHAGAVVGADGFGYVRRADGSYEKTPQLGNVVVGDDAEIGACACIDRGTLESTVIEAGVKLDNLVHIAHNVRVGEGTAMAAQAGVAGSTDIGFGVQVGGQVGISGHLRVGDGAVIGAQAGVTKSIQPGTEVWGTPAREKKKVLRQMAGSRALRDLTRQLAALRERIEALGEQVSLLDRAREE